VVCRWHLGTCIIALVIVSYQELVASIVEPGIGYRFVN
jgi:hypothetical protein